MKMKNKKDTDQKANLNRQLNDPEVQASIISHMILKNNFEAKKGIWKLVAVKIKKH